MYANITTNLENQKPINEIRSRNANQIMMVTRKKLQRALTHALLLTYAHTQSSYYMTSKLQIHGTSQLSQASKP